MSRQAARCRMAATVMFVAGCLAAALGGARPAEAVVLINEVLANPGGLDANEDGTPHIFQDEFLELVNPSNDPFTLTGWTLSDGVGSRHVFAPGTSISAGGLLVVFGGGNPAAIPNALKASTGTLGLNNTGDTVSLRDATDTLIDLLLYTAAQVVPGESLTRFPDALGPFTRHLTVSTHPFSPGTTTDGSPQLPTPEPATLWLMGVGLLGAATFRRHRHS